MLAMTRDMQKRRQFMVDLLDDERAPRLGPALNAIRGTLAQGGWWPHAGLVAAAQAAAELSPVTIRGRIAEAVYVGCVEKRGAWKPGHGRWPGKVVPASDTREYRLIDWPEPS